MRNFITMGVLSPYLPLKVKKGQGVIDSKVFTSLSNFKCKYFQVSSKLDLIFRVVKSALVSNFVCNVDIYHAYHYLYIISIFLYIEI